jgi:hypothetical protein
MFTTFRVQAVGSRKFEKSPEEPWCSALHSFNISAEETLLMEVEGE